MAVRLIEWVSTSFRARGRTSSLSLTGNAMLTSCINEIHPHCLGFITNYWAFFAMPHVETMPVRLYSADLVSATKQLVDCHEMRYRNSLQKTVKCEFRENQRCDGHTLPKGVNEIMYFLSFSSCLDIIWQGRCPQKLTR